MTKISLPKDFSNVHIHFVGIKGTGMAALVEIIKSRGAIITGSDVEEHFYTDDILEKLGIKSKTFSKDNITDDIQYIIYSAAYSLETNEDLIEAVSKNIPCILYTDALGDISSSSYSVGICGVHGKTSTTGIVGTIFKQLDLPVQVLAGSVIPSFENRCTMTTSEYSLQNERNYFIAETCEYKRHFMSFHPKKIILTSVESDHQDFFPTFEDIQKAFVDYICLLPKNGVLIYCADDKGATDTANIAFSKRSDLKLIPYGENASGDYKLTFGKVENEKQFFEIASLGNFEINVPGKHFIRNTCAAVALVCEIIKTQNKNISNYVSNIKKGVSQFTGGKRRSEIIGRSYINNNSVIFIDDYAHHPTAIKTTLAGYREFFSGRKIIVDFMSHTYSRTEALLDDFASSFSCSDIVILHKIYASARESKMCNNISGKTLFENTKKYHSAVYYFEEILDAKSFVIKELSKKLGKDFPNGYLFITMGAGDNWKLSHNIYNEVARND